MPDGFTIVSVIVGFALVTVAGAKLGAGSHTSLQGLFPAQGRRDWPTGVQEVDAPRFVFAPPSIGPLSEDTAPGPMIGDLEELYAGPIRPVNPTLGASRLLEEAYGVGGGATVNARCRNTIV